jgi:hypothetical protein
VRPLKRKDGALTCETVWHSLVRRCDIRVRRGATLFACDGVRRSRRGPQVMDLDRPAEKRPVIPDGARSGARAGPLLGSPYGLKEE